MTDQTRRQALESVGKISLGGLAGILGSCGPRRTSKVIGQEKARTKRWGMLVDLRRCIGCQACTVACKAENNVPLGVFRRTVRSFMSGTYPNARRTFVPVSCFHCKEPPCLKSCPEKAIYKTEDGFVLIDKEKCTTEKNCTKACPYQNIFIDPEEMTADKCTFCVHRVKKGITPACVQTCEGDALLFGDINDPKSKISKTIRENKAKVLKPGEGTKPSFFYIGLDAEAEKTMERLLARRGQLKPSDLENDR